MVVSLVVSLSHFNLTYGVLSLHPGANSVANARLTSPAVVYESAAQWQCGAFKSARRKKDLPGS